MRVIFLLAGLTFIAVLPQDAYSENSPDRITILEEYHGYYPCMDCHEDQESNATPRILEEEHLEPLEWEDDAGVTHTVPFGTLVALGDLLGQANQEKMLNRNLARIGQRLSIQDYMDDNGLAPEDSVWTIVHGGGNLWCLDCHDPVDRNKLVKFNGETLSFNDSHLLCGECHGPKLRDWDSGIHGKTTGYWDQSQDTEGVSVQKQCVECHLSHSPVFPSEQPLAGPVLRLDPIGKSKESH